MSPEPRWTIVVWASFFVAINLIHSIWLVYERHLARLTEDEQRIYETAFKGLDSVSVRKLLRRGDWITFENQDCLVRVRPESS